MAEQRDHAGNFQSNAVEPRVSTPLMARLATAAPQTNSHLHHADAMASRWRTLTGLHLCIAVTGLLHIILEPFASNVHSTGWWSGGMGVLVFLTFLLTHFKVKSTNFNLLHESAKYAVIHHLLWLGAGLGVDMVALVTEILVISKPDWLNVKEETTLIDYLRVATSSLQFLLNVAAFLKILTNIYWHVSINSQPIIYLGRDQRSHAPPYQHASYGSTSESSTHQDQPVAFAEPQENPVPELSSENLAAAATEPEQVLSVHGHLDWHVSEATSTAADAEGTAAFPPGKVDGFWAGRGLYGQDEKEDDPLLQ